MSYAYPPQQAWQPYPMRTTAPASLHVVAFFQYLGGLLMLAVAAVLGLAALDVIPAYTYTTGDSTWSTRQGEVTVVAAIVCGVFALVGLVAVVLGRKVQRGRNWARVLLTVLNLFSVAGAAWQVYAAPTFMPSMLVGVAVPLLFVVLLNTRAARSWCHRRTY